MAFVPIPQGIQSVIQLQHSGTGQVWENVLHWFKYTGGPVTGTDVEDVAEWLATTFWTTYKSCISNQVKLVQCYARDISHANGTEYVTATNSGQVGTVSGDALPGNSALAISWRTTATGRRNRGRTYISGITEGHVANDRIDAGQVALMFQIIAALLGADIDGTKYFAVRSLADALMKVVASGIIETVLDSQRRRLLGRGR